MHDSLFVLLLPGVTVPSRARAKNYPTQQNKEPRVYAWQLLSGDWPFVVKSSLGMTRRRVHSGSGLPLVVVKINMISPLPKIYDNTIHVLYALKISRRPTSEIGVSKHGLQTTSAKPFNPTARTFCQQ